MKRWNGVGPKIKIIITLILCFISPETIHTKDSNKINIENLLIYENYFANDFCT